MTAPTGFVTPAPGTSDPTNVHVWETGDLYVFDPDTVFVPATDIPADIDTPLSRRTGCPPGSCSAIPVSSSSTISTRPISTRGS